jgi:hypothetical protein
MKRHVSSAREDAPDPRGCVQPRTVTVCVTTLRKRATFGRGVLDAAMSAPIAGCITKNGATSVMELTSQRFPSRSGLASA